MSVKRTFDNVFIITENCIRKIFQSLTCLKNIFQHGKNELFSILYDVSWVLAKKVTKNAYEIHKFYFMFFIVKFAFLVSAISSSQRKLLSSKILKVLPHKESKVIYDNWRLIMAAIFDIIVKTKSMYVFKFFLSKNNAKLRVFMLVDRQITHFKREARKF